MIITFPEVVLVPVVKVTEPVPGDVMTISPKLKGFTNVTVETCCENKVEVPIITKITIRNTLAYSWLLHLFM